MNHIHNINSVQRCRWDPCRPRCAWRRKEPDVPVTKLRCGFFWAGFLSSDGRQYYERSESNSSSNYHYTKLIYAPDSDLQDIRILPISPTRCTILLNIFTSLLYMFRASTCPSSGEHYCIYATLVFATLYG